MNATPTITIALADDHALVVNAFARLLNQTPGMRVIITAADGAELIDKLEKADVLPDICLLDINMPEMNGYETLPVLRRRWPAIKVLALSMYGGEEFPVVKMIADGACGFIDKSKDELAAAITHTQQHGYYLGGAVARFLPHGLDQAKKLQVNITDHEMQFLKLFCTGKEYHEIAKEMGKSDRTIHNYRDSLFSKLGVNSKTGLALLASRIGLNPQIAA